MARQVYKYQPVNETPDVAIGIALPFNVSSHTRPVDVNYASGSMSGKSLFYSNYTTELQSISNLQNLLLTRKGERYMQPNFGTDINKILFTNNTSDVRSSLKKTLIKDLKYWLPYISINDVMVTTSSDMHSITIAIYFKIENIGSNLVINVIASENSFQVTDATADTTNTSTELRQISNVY
tara:strand:+ start:1552 stop:2094 length:543 start_codon:yes stop_codon:yes gene_type:complete